MIARSRSRLRPAFVTTVALSVTACGASSADGTGASPTTSTGGSAGTAADNAKGGAGQAGTGGAAPTGGIGGSGGATAGTGGSAGSPNPPSCQASHPLMNDPCASEGITCEYPTDVCTEVYSCVKGRWNVVSLGVGTCNPPAPCPAEEPKAGVTCGGGLQLAPKGCRYAHAGCFTYWNCQDAAWISAAPAADGCCPAAAPASAASCAESGVQCTYPGEVATCAATGWAISMPSGAGGAGNAGASGSAGAGG